MAMRNWWIEATIDGRKNVLKGGPVGRTGGFEIHVYQRVDGESIQTAVIDGYAREDGTLDLHLSPCHHDTPGTRRSEYRRHGDAGPVDSVKITSQR